MALAKMTRELSTRVLGGRTVGRLPQRRGAWFQSPTSA